LALANGQWNKLLQGLLPHLIFQQLKIFHYSYPKYRSTFL
jgi:hypothetical protein